MAADFLELAAALQAFGNRQRIGRLVVLDQQRYVAVNLAMISAVEIAVADLIGNFFPCGVVEQQPAQHRLLGLERVRRQLERVDLRIAIERGYGLGHGEVLRF